MPGCSQGEGEKTISSPHSPTRSPPPPGEAWPAAPARDAHARGAPCPGRAAGAGARAVSRMARSLLHGRRHPGPRPGHPRFVVGGDGHSFDGAVRKGPERGGGGRQRQRGGLSPLRRARRQPSVLSPLRRRGSFPPGVAALGNAGISAGRGQCGRPIALRVRAGGNGVRVRGFPSEGHAQAGGPQGFPGLESRGRRRPGPRALPRHAAPAAARVSGVRSWRPFSAAPRAVRNAGGGGDVHRPRCGAGPLCPGCRRGVGGHGLPGRGPGGGHAGFGVVLLPDGRWAARREGARHLPRACPAAFSEAQCPRCHRPWGCGWKTRW